MPRCCKGHEMIGRLFTRRCDCNCQCPARRKNLARTMKVQTADKLPYHIMDTFSIHELGDLAGRQMNPADLSPKLLHYRVRQWNIAAGAKPLNVVIPYGVAAFRPRDKPHE